MIQYDLTVGGWLAWPRTRLGMTRLDPKPDQETSQAGLGSASGSADFS